MNKLNSSLLQELKNISTSLAYSDIYRLLKGSSRLPASVKKEYIDEFITSSMKNLKKSGFRNYFRVIEIFNSEATFRKHDNFSYEIFHLTPYQASALIKSLQPDDLQVLS